MVNCPEVVSVVDTVQNCTVDVESTPMIPPKEFESSNDADVDFDWGPVGVVPEHAPSIAVAAKAAAIREGVFIGSGVAEGESVPLQGRAVGSSKFGA